jgi:hypothetical protein
MSMAEMIIAARVRRPLPEAAVTFGGVANGRARLWPASTSRGGWCYDFGMIVFDELAKILAAPMGRRKALKLAGKAITGGVLASLAVGQTHAKTCKDGTMRCHGQGFDTCEHGKWVFSKCAPGTTCVQNGLTILCEPRPEYQPGHD